MRVVIAAGDRHVTSLLPAVVIPHQPPASLGGSKVSEYSILRCGKTALHARGDPLNLVRNRRCISAELKAVGVKRLGHQRILLKEKQVTGSINGVGSAAEK